MTQRQSSAVASVPEQERVARSLVPCPRRKSQPGRKGAKRSRQSQRQRQRPSLPLIPPVLPLLLLLLVLVGLPAAAFVPSNKSSSSGRRRASFHGKRARRTRETRPFSILAIHDTDSPSPRPHTWKDLLRQPSVPRSTTSDSQESTHSQQQIQRDRGERACHSSHGLDDFAHHDDNDDEIGVYSQPSSDTVLPNPPPRHVAIVCDGNSRWAEHNGVPTSVGHYEGAQRLVNDVVPTVLRHADTLTLYVFSSENWNRPDDEVRSLFDLMVQMSRKFRQRALEEKLRVRIVGDMQDERLPAELTDTLRDLEAATDNTASDKTLCLAVNYGGRQDIVQAVRKIVRDAVESEATPDAASHITEQTIEDNMWTSAFPQQPDLFIRTSGESRVSNFLLWNIAYSEIYITKVNFPDFDATECEKAIRWYRQRKRRFGGR